MSVGVCSVEVVMPCMIQMRNTQMVTDNLTQTLTIEELLRRLRAYENCFTVGNTGRD